MNTIFKTRSFQLAYSGNSQDHSRLDIDIYCRGGYIKSGSRKHYSAYFITINNQYWDSATEKANVVVDNIIVGHLLAVADGFQYLQENMAKIISLVNSFNCKWCVKIHSSNKKIVNALDGGAPLKLKHSEGIDAYKTVEAWVDGRCAEAVFVGEAVQNPAYLLSKEVDHQERDSMFECFPLHYCTTDAT